MSHSKKEFKVPIELAWAAVAYADRVNDNEYVNDATYFEPGKVVKETNKKLAYQALANPELITDGDHRAGKDYADHFKGLLFGAIKAQRQNGFMETVTKVIGMTEVGRFEIACMAALPKSYRRDIAREEKDSRQLALSPTSMYIGNVGEKIQTNVEIIDCVYSRNYNIYIYTATDDRNVIKFTSAKDSTTFKVGARVSVKGTVKRHSDNDRNGVHETWLNRVKVV